MKPYRVLARGFTLIEILVVVAIIAILGAVIVPKIMSRPDEARITAAREDVASLMQALKMYKLDNGFYPSAEQGLAALVSKPTSQPTPMNWKSYLDKLPVDPWGHPYVYMNPGVKGDVDVMSYGPSGQPAGDGNDTSIGSWML